MATDRDNYQWRPNDNSVTTQTRYDLEIEHYIRSIKSAQIGANTPSMGGSLAVIGLVINLVLLLITFIIVVIVDFIKWFNYKRGQHIKK